MKDRQHHNNQRRGPRDKRRAHPTPKLTINDSVGSGNRCDLRIGVIVRSDLDHVSAYNVQVRNAQTAHDSDAARHEECQKS